jgi:hypothetical protein
MPSIESTFKSGEPSLPDLLRDIQTGEIQLPDFQRGWVWDDDHIRSLIASVSLSYPIGAVMLLQTGGDGTQFQPRPIEGVVADRGKKPEYLILDGQQRMTSLYLALLSGKPVPTMTEKDAPIERVYYLDIARCLDPEEDRVDAVLSVPPDRKITSDFGRKVEMDLGSNEVLRDLDATAFLTAVTLLTSYRRSMQQPELAVSCKRRDVLKLSLGDLSANADAIERGLDLSARFLAREKVFDTKSLPYSTQLIPLSVICAMLGDHFERDAVRSKLAQWFWCGVFGELYGGANETRFALDVPEVMAWIRGGDLPRTVRDASFSPTRLLTIQTRLSAAYKGLMALLMKEGSADFLSGDRIEISSYFDVNIDIHHIFPRAYCEKQNLSRTLWNSAVNKAPLSAKSNRVIGGRPPSQYLRSIEQSYGMPTERLDEILRSHQIDPALLRSDSFEEFIRNRAGNLLDLIERAMGKAISGRDGHEVIREFGGPLPAGRN